MKHTILITGAGSGLGRGLGRCLAQNGHRILATDLREENARETAAQITAAGGEAEAHALDVTSEADVARLCAQLGGQPVGVLINNAGLQHVSPLEDFPTASGTCSWTCSSRGRSC